MIRTTQTTDAKQLTDIYNYYILNSVVTFEIETISVNEMAKRIQSVSYEMPWFVYEEQDEIIGYAYATKWKERKAYKNTVEITVYLKHGKSKKGIGSKLYSALIEELKQKKIHCVIGGISLPNNASIALHEKFGFTKVAHFKEVGFKFNEWIDVGYWQLILNV